MSYELDMSQYVELFLQEGREQLEILEQETLKLEQDPSTERLQVIFRLAHTLKGSALAMDYPHMAELTHEMENVLDNLRNGVIQVTMPIANALLQCQDILGKMIDSIEGGNGDKVECASLVKSLQGFVGWKETSKPAVAPSLLSEAVSSNEFKTLITADHFENLNVASKAQSVYHLQMKLADDCAMKFVRAFMAISTAQESGEILASYPSIEDLEEEKFETEFEFVFQSTAALSDLFAKLGEISEVASFTLNPWKCPETTEAQASPNEISSVAARVEEKKPEKRTEPAPGQAPSTSGKKAETGQTVRVDVSRLDTLMNLVGELVIDRTRIAQIGAELAAKHDDGNIDALAETVGHIHRITSDLQDQLIKARMLPIENVFNRFPRVVRDLAQKLNKDVKLNLIGSETELDRSIIEVIGDPLLHILRNSIDHGLETPQDRVKVGKPEQGFVTLSARHQENHIVIEIEDDGKGIDVDCVKAKAIEKGQLTKDQADRLTEKEGLQLIFASGLSTAAEITELSGRGVGMDIVRCNVEKLGGIIDLESTLGQGTKFILRLPLTLTIIRGLLVKVEETVYVTPLGSVIETLLIDRSQIQTINRREVIVIRGVTTPLVRLREVFPKKKSSKKQDINNQLYVVIVGLAEQRVGLVVDGLIGEREVVIKSLSQYCGEVGGISGATILGDGNVALIMDVNSIVNLQKAS
jgi:two-component system chemotaxis sensor kinase CheA